MTGAEPAKTLAAAQAWLRKHDVSIVYEDNHVLGVNKPPGLLSQPGPEGAIALPEVIDRYRQLAEGKPGRAYVGLVHRIDWNVSGVLVIAKTSKAAARLSALFHDRDESLRKTYLAWVRGGPATDAGRLEHRAVRRGRVTELASPRDADARTAQLSYHVEARSTRTRATRLRVLLETGVRHQIRFQLAAAGMPILGDVKYGGPEGARPALHASELSFPHPVRRDEVVVLSAELPSDLRALDRSLGLERR